MEKIGHFLDDAVAKIYKNLKREGFTKAEASPLIAERLNISKILRKASKNWDGGYAMAGLLGHGDSFFSKQRRETLAMPAAQRSLTCLE